MLTPFPSFVPQLLWPCCPGSGEAAARMNPARQDNMQNTPDVFKLKAGPRLMVSTALILVLLCNAVGVAASRQCFRPGEAELLRPAAGLILLARMGQSVENDNESPPADTAAAPPWSTPAEITKTVRLRLRPAAVTLPILFPSRHPSLPRPPPA